jgi:hypothetical protein
MIRTVIAAAVFSGIVAIGLAPVANAVPFKNCTQARDAGYEDIPSSSEYYGPWLDRDADGVGCESSG